MSQSVRVVCVVSMLCAGCPWNEQRCPPGSRTIVEQSADEGPASAPSLVRSAVCYVDGVSMRVHALDLPKRAALQVRALPNPSVHRDARCAGQYGGDALPSLTVESVGLDVIAATNGNFFEWTASGARSNGLVWTRARDGARLLSPMQSTTNADMRGDRIVVFDADGLHELRINTGACEPGACRTRINADGAVASARPPLDRGDFSDTELTAAIERAFPNATLALQVNAALADGTPHGAAEALAPGWQCPTDATSPAAWKCERQPATLLCGHPDGGVSLYAVEPAHYGEMVWGLREGGACGATCSLLYVLDGGHSTQLATRGEDGWQMRYARYYDEHAPGGCPQFRAVDHYLVVGRE